MSWAHYMLQVNIYLLVFYGFYKLLLDKETYFTLNRIYLVFAGLLALTIPFLRFEWFTKQEVAQPVYISVDQVMGQFNIIQEESSSFSTGNLIVLIYLAGILFFATRFILRLWGLSRKLNQQERGEAFSFFRKKRIDPNLPQVDTVHKHEDTHVRQWHSIDVIFFEVLSIFTWFNPIIYFYKNAVKSIHEYLADDEAAKFQGSKDEYALLLLSNAFGIPVNTLSNSFFNKSLIKRRVFMLYKDRSRKMAIAKYGLAIPLLAFALILSSATIRDNKNIQKIADNIPLNTPLEAVNEVVAASVKPILPEGLKTTSSSKKNISKPQNANSKQATEAPGNSGINQEQDPVHDFSSIDTPPTFVGGMGKFYEYLKNNVKYPEEAVKNNVQGRVFLSFIVEKDGSLSNIKVMRRLGAGTDEEAVRVLEESPKWNPGTAKGKAVRVKYNIPISFNMTKTSSTPDSTMKRQGLEVTGIRFGDSNGGTLKLGENPEKEPLVFIDGVEANMSMMKNMDPNKIESINVLKNANATAIYGTKGANGVLIITTKEAAKNLKQVVVEPKKTDK